MLEIIKEFIKDFLPLGVLLTFLISLVNIYITTKTQKKTKFIDTITSERIKWLEIIRNESSHIISELTEYSNSILAQIEDIKNTDPSENRTIEVNFEYQKNYFNAKNSSVLSSKKLWTKSEFIKNLNLFKLRLNYIEDIEIIKILDRFIGLIKLEYLNENDINNLDKDLELFIQNIQIVLKDEWEKVKKETK